MTHDRRNYTSLQAAVANFMQLGGQTTNGFNARQACLYMGLQLEELAEKVEAIRGGTMTPAQDQHLRVLQSTLEMFAREFKAGMHEGDITRANHADLIDADFDLAWVSLGALYSTAINGYHAIAHGTFTNMDKFRGGVCERDENGKIKKPADWIPPDFTSYVDPTPRG